MSSLMDGIDYMNSIDVQINQIRNQAASSISQKDSSETVIDLQKSFGTILDNFLATSDQSNSNGIFSNINMIDSQISALTADTSALSADPNLAILTFQKNFNTIISDFYSSPDEENGDNEKNDTFGAWSGFETSINNLQSQAQKIGSANSKSLLAGLYTNSSSDMFSSINYSQNNASLMAMQNQSNLFNIF